MRNEETLRKIDACIDAGVAVPPELAARVRAQPRLRRTAQALERVDLLLRAELGLADGAPSPESSARLLARLPARRSSWRPRRWAGVAALAAGALLWIGLGDTATDAAPGALPSLFGSADRDAGDVGVPLAQWLDWRVPLAPERVLLEEAELLASDTRRTAASLWSRLPLTSLLAREEP